MNTPKASDIVVEITVSDETTGAALNLNDYAGIVVYVYQQENSNILRKYSKVASTGFELLTVTNAATGKLEIYIPRSITKTTESKILYAEVKLKKADATAEGGFFYSIVTGIEIDLMEDSVSPAESIPS